MNKYRVTFIGGYSMDIIAVNENDARYKAAMYSSQPIQSVCYIGV